jgi:prevent-host-death family protein
MSATEPAAQFNIHEAKTHLPGLVERAAAGEEIIISKAGQPMARLGPVPKTPTPRKPGRWRGRVVVHDDFDELPPEIAAAFRGGAAGGLTLLTSDTRISRYAVTVLSGS